MKKITVTVNSKPMDVAVGATFNSLLDKLNLPKNNLAVEYNGNFLNPDADADFNLADGDRLEIVRFVGGG